MGNSEQTPSLKRIRYAVFVFYFCQGLIFSSWASRIPDLKTSLNMNDASWGTMLLMIAIGQLCGMTMSGFLVSKFGGKKILLVMLPFYSFILLPISLVDTSTAMIPLLILYGIFSNFMNIAVNTQGIAIENMYNKSIMSSFHGGWSLAGFTGALIGFLMIYLHIIPFYHFLIMGILVVVTASFNFKYLPKEIVKKQEDSLTKKKAKRPEAFLYLLGIVAFCGMFVEGTMFDWSGVYFKDIVEVSPTLVPVGFTCFMIMMASGRFIADKAVDKWGRRRIIQTCGLFSFTGLLIAVAFPYLITTTLAFMLVGLGVSSIVPMVYSIAGQKTNIPTSIALTVVSSISFFGFLLGPPVIGYISAATNLRYSFAAVSIFALIIIVLTSQINVFKKEK